MGKRALVNPKNGVGEIGVFSPTKSTKSTKGTKGTERRKEGRGRGMGCGFGFGHKEALPSEATQERSDQTRIGLRGPSL